jgi:adenylate kinase
MGIIEDEVKRLTGVVEGLESRIKQLEQKSFGSTTKSTEEIRMILMGPPGAGTASHLAFCARRC